LLFERVMTSSFRGASSGDVAGVLDQGHLAALETCGETACEGWIAMCIVAGERCGRAANGRSHRDSTQAGISVR
jgi:hypothetical protein